MEIFTCLFDCVGVRVEYLPPYSPDLNPIEEAFSKINAFIRRHSRLLVHVGDGLIYDLMELVIVAGNPGVFQAYPYPYPPKPLPPPRVRVLTGRGPGFEGLAGQRVDWYPPTR